MKKIIISMFAFAITATLSGAVLAHAESSFNNPGSMPTITVANDTTNPCSMGPVNGCWKQNVSAKAGDVVAVHIYYKNTSNTVAEETTLAIQPKNNGSSISFGGGVASISGPRATGNATVSLSSGSTVSYISGSAVWYPSATSGAYAVNESALFGSNGFNIGDVMPGEQGVLVANFRVNGSSSNNDDDECVINTFRADDTSIDEGDSTRLRWTTTGCDYVDIRSSDQNFSDENADGNVTIRPDEDTTYTLRAYGFNGRLGDTDTEKVNVDGKSIRQTSAPQAVTTVASVLGGYSAQLNGIAVPNTTTGSTIAWFEWGISGSLGSRTQSQSIPSNGGTTYYNATVSGLTPGAVYYYRAVVQNQNGTAYGDIVRFQTTRSTISTPTVTVKTVTVKDTTVTSKSQASLLELKVTTSYERMCIGGSVEYTVMYRNISSQSLTDTVLRITHPKEITYLSSSYGKYEVVDRALTIDLGTVAPGESGTVTISARVNSEAVRGNLAVTTASVVYTNSLTRGQEDAIAYSLLTISDECPSVLVANTFGFGSFLPDTLLEWLLLILVILALILLARQFYKKKDENKY